MKSPLIRYATRLLFLIGTLMSVAPVATAQANPVHLGGVINGTPSCVSADGSWLHCFARGSDNRIYVKNNAGGTGWGAYEAAGSQVVAGDPSCISKGLGNYSCFMRGTDNAMWELYWTGAWTWYNHGGALGGEPDCFTRDGKTHCAVRGSGGNLLYRGYNGSAWMAWQNLGGIFEGKPSCISESTSRVDCFVINAAGYIYQKVSQDSGVTWAGFYQLAGSFKGSPSCVSRGSGDYHCFGQGSANELRHVYWSSGWYTETLGGVISADPDCVTNGRQDIGCFVRGSDGKIFSRNFTPATGWQSYQTPSWVMQGAAGCTGGRFNEYNCAARGTDNAMWVWTVTVAPALASGWNSSAGQSWAHNNPRFLLTLSSTQTVQLDLLSSVDTYLYVLNEAGTAQIAADDDSGDGYNSRLNITLGAGKYQIVAATYSGSQRDDFTIATNGGSLARCFFAYEHGSYGGNATQFCSGLSASFLNDSYSSLRVPKGMYVRAAQHGNGSGLKRTYYTDTPWVGNLYNDMLSQFQWGDFQMNDFMMVQVSDPQFSWTACTDNSSSAICTLERNYFGTASEEDIGRTYNWNVVNAINSVKSNRGDGAFGGAIINGDLTEFGKQDIDLTDYVDIYEHGLNTNMYLGLGNHDYANNVDDCYENQCASNMVWYLNEQVQTLNPTSFDYSESGSYYSFPSYRKDHNGSLGYSYDVGNVHFVQLNNYPTYTRQWNGWNFSGARRDYFDIRSSISWLRNDLATAQAQGKKLVLNMHDWGAAGGNAEFQSVLNDYKISAVFAGHWHTTFGQGGTAGPFADGKTIPIYFSGAPHYGDFLVSRFQGSKLYVFKMVVDHFSNANLRVLYNGNFTSVNASNMGTIFDVSGTRYYEYSIDMR